MTHLFHAVLHNFYFFFKTRSGIHVDGAAGPATRLGYTIMKVMGVDTPSWGTKSNNTANALSEILV